jgi:hypothetical protein
MTQLLLKIHINLLTTNQLTPRSFQQYGNSGETLRYGNNLIQNTIKRGLQIFWQYWHRLYTYIYPRPSTHYQIQCTTCVSTVTLQLRFQEVLHEKLIPKWYCSAVGEERPAVPDLTAGWLHSCHTRKIEAPFTLELWVESSNLLKLHKAHCLVILGRLMLAR